MDTLETITPEREPVEDIFARAVFIPALSGYLDPLTGDTWPAIAGASDDDNDDDQNNDDDDDEGEDDNDDDDQDEKALNARIAKANRSAAKKATRKLARDLGFSSVGEMRTVIGEQNNNDSSKNTKDDDNSSSKSENTDPNDKAERRSKVTIAVAESGIDPKKIKRAAGIVFNDLDGDDFDRDDLSDAIDELREDEPGWFPSTSNDEDDGKDEVRGRSVLGSKPQRRKQKNSVGVAEAQATRIKKRNSTKSIFNS